jgi:excisionase family DNA binding protein
VTDAAFYSPAEVSRALGVSTSTIKRWVDEGVLPARKTAGGHRRILRADVLRLAREGNFPQRDLSRLGFPARPDDTDPARLARRLLDGLREGDMARTRAVIHGAYAAGLPLEGLGDAVIAPAMARLGHEWEAGHIDVWHEHRGTLLCAGALHELRPALEANAANDRPVAAGGSPEGDHSVLAGLLIQMVLLDAGWEAVNFGPHTPLASFRAALGELKPRLVWLSASHLPDPEMFLREYGEFYAQAAGAGVAVAVGGQALEGSLRAVMPSTFHGTSLSDLAAFARALHPRPRPPKRGRPAGPPPRNR